MLNYAIFPLFAIFQVESCCLFRKWWQFNDTHRLAQMVYGLECREMCSRLCLTFTMWRVG